MLKSDNNYLDNTIGDNTMNMSSLSSQRGMGYWGIVSVIIMLVVLGKLGISTVPAYLDNVSLDELIEDRLKAGQKKSAESILKDIQRQMKINSTSAGDVNDMVTVINGTPGNVILKMDYEVRSNLFAHIFVVSKFEKEYKQK